MLLQMLKRRSSEETIRRRCYCGRQRLRSLMLMLQLMQLQLWLYLWLYGCRGQWLPIGNSCGLRLLVSDLCNNLLLLLLRLLLVLDAYLGRVLQLLRLRLMLWLRLRLIGNRLAMLLRLMLNAGTGRGKLLLIVVTLVFIIVLREIALRVAQRDIRLALMLLQIDGLVEIVVDNMILRGLLADVVVRWGHANQMDLMESKALRADPRMLLTLLAVVEDLTVQRLIGIVAAKIQIN